MGEERFMRMWEDRWRIAACLVPAFLIVFFANRAVLPLAAKLRDVSSQLELMRENTYESTWLDSTQTALKGEVDLLRGFKNQREQALTTDGSIQITVDRIRGLAQKSGIEVTKTTPILSRAEPLRLLKVRMEGYTHYSGLLQFFDNLKSGHPNLFLEEMTVRLGGERADGKLESHLILNVYDRKNGEIP